MRYYLLRWDNIGNKWFVSAHTDENGFSDINAAYRKLEQIRSLKSVEHFLISDDPNSQPPAPTKE